MRRALLLGAVLLLLTLPAAALTESVWDSIDTRELERQGAAATDLRLTPETSLEEGLAGLLEDAGGQLPRIVRSRLRSGALVLTVALLSGLTETMCRETGAGDSHVSRLVCAVTLTGAALGDMHSLMTLGRETVERLADFDRVLIPVLTAAAAASGSVTGAAARQMVTLLCVNLLLTLMKGVLIPMLYLYVAASTGAAAADRPGLDAIAAFLRALVQQVLKWLLILFTAYLSVSGVIAGSADKAAAKLTRFAISGMVPVVGGILSDATESVLAGAGVLRGAIGAFGTVAVLGFCLTPFLHLGVQYLIYRVAAVLSALVGSPAAAGLVERIGDAFSLVLAMTGTAALLTLISVMLTTAAAVS